MSSEQPQATRASDGPLFFISHKHADSRIASVIASFVRTRSGGRVEVFQSSSLTAAAPRIGRGLNQELMNALWRASTVALIYTSSDQDWDYCMWECGVAMDPESPDTRIIVLQCGASAPTIFADQVRVDPRKPADIHRLVKAFLTGTDFFPGSPQPIAPGFSPDGAEVAEAAQELFDKLQPVLPPPDAEAVEDWPAWPYVQLELGYEQTNKICAAGRQERTALTLRLLETECTVRKGDREAQRLFGMAGFTGGMKFSELIDSWREGEVTPDSRWLEALARQIAPAARWKFPEPVWELMQGLDGDAWYAPMLNWVTRRPSERVMLFDVYFQKFEMGPDGTPIFGLRAPPAARE
ncbi:hypothetical protein [Longimicrobium sp.]|uniref:hypothetical protein n=1 Tax=Longimicrobium sp. TaxID=2029185 RepID=UPI003B3B2777